jgi:hypothetical protein
MVWAKDIPFWLCMSSYFDSYPFLLLWAGHNVHTFPLLFVLLSLWCQFDICQLDCIFIFLSLKELEMQTLTLFHLFSHDNGPAYDRSSLASLKMPLKKNVNNFWHYSQTMFWHIRIFLLFCWQEAAIKK